MDKERRTTASKPAKTPATPRLRKSKTRLETNAPALHPDAIAKRAYELFLQDGERHGADLAHWLRAEQELHATAAQGH